jgi:hypothetical protein
MTMTLPPSPVELILSQRAAKSLRGRQLEPASDHPPHFAAQWRVELCKDWAGRNLFMVTNLATLFTFLIPRAAKQVRARLEQDFRSRLGFALLVGKPLVDWQPDPIVYARGNPRKVIGSMNEMIYNLQFPSTEAFRRAHPEQDDEDRLNHTPFSAIGSKNRYEFPDKAWSAAIARLAE